MCQRHFTNTFTIEKPLLITAAEKPNIYYIGYGRLYRNKLIENYEYFFFRKNFLIGKLGASESAFFTIDEHFARCRCCVFRPANQCFVLRVFVKIIFF